MEKAYFPMKVCNITQGYGSNTYSHSKTVALDIAGADSGKDYAYAPFTGTVKKIYNTDHQVWFASNSKVLCADGEERYLVMLLGHDDELRVKVGAVVKQGDVIYREGTYSNSSKITGNHIHMELGSGPFTGSGWFQNSSGVWQINSPLAPEKILWLKSDTVIKNTVAGGKNYMMKWDKEEVAYPFELGAVIYPIEDVVLKSNAGYGNESLWTLAKGTKCIVSKYNNVHGLYMALKNEAGEYFNSAWSSEFDKFTLTKPEVDKNDGDEKDIDDDVNDVDTEDSTIINKILKAIINFIAGLFKK